MGAHYCHIRASSAPTPNSCPFTPPLAGQPSMVILHWPLVIPSVICKMFVHAHLGPSTPEPGSAPLVMGIRGVFSACPIFVGTENSRRPAQYVGIGHWDGEKIILGAGTEIVENGSIGIGLKNVVLSFWRTRTHILTVSVT